MNHFRKCKFHTTSKWEIDDIFDSTVILGQPTTKYNFYLIEKNKDQEEDGFFFLSFGFGMTAGSTHPPFWIISPRGATLSEAIVQ